MRKKCWTCKFCHSFVCTNPITTNTSTDCFSLSLSLLLSNISLNQWKLDFEMFLKKKLGLICVWVRALARSNDKISPERKENVLVQSCAYATIAQFVGSNTLISLLQCWRKNVLNSQIKKGMQKKWKEIENVNDSFHHENG